MDGHGEIESSPTHLLTPAGTGLKRDEQLYQTEGWEPGQPLSQAPWDPFQVAASRLGLPAGREVGTGNLLPSKGSGVIWPESPPPCLRQPMLLVIFPGIKVRRRACIPADVYWPPLPCLEAAFECAVGLGGESYGRPQQPSSPCLQVWVTGVWGWGGGLTFIRCFCRPEPALSCQPSYLGRTQQRSSPPHPIKGCLATSTCWPLVPSPNLSSSCK